MSPRRGGETDKLGNKYELAWVIRHALYCIRDEHRFITAEDVDIELSKGSEFTYVTNTGVEVHQLKRQYGNNNHWSITALTRLKIFETAAQHVAAGRQYHFVSLTPCGSLRELAERARMSADLASFTQFWLTEELRPPFDELSADGILGSPAMSWATLRGMWFHVHDEHDIIRVNSMLAEVSLEGAAGHPMSLTLGDIVLNNLGKRLTRIELLEQLATHGIHPIAEVSRTSAHDQVRAATESWRGTIQRELLQPFITRVETGQLIDALNINRLGLVVGTAGGGKSSVLEQAVASLKAAGAEVLALRLDRLGSFASTADLGRQLGLDTSPAAALALAANGREAYLVIDQVDAVSLASGRMPESFDVVMDLIGEALSVAHTRVILACREFDVDNDHRIRALAARSDIHRVRVGELSIEAVEAAVAAMGLDSAQLSASQRALLQTPLHLVLLSGIASQEDALAFQSKGSLFEAFWQRKRQTVKARRASVRFHDVITRVATVVSDRQELSVPIDVLDEGDLIEDAHVLVSEHVLAQDGDRIAFFHESFFDYAFARQWVLRSESLVNFLCRGEQELFRRAQVRQILQHLHERELDRFLNEVEQTLNSNKIRFHIKEAVLAVLANLSAPTSEEAELILRIAATKPRFEERLWQQLCRPQWFLRFYREGMIAAWLDSADQKATQRALNYMVSGAKNYGGHVAELLGDRQAAPEYLNWLRWIVRFASVYTDRQLFDLMLPAVRQGNFDNAQHELWMAVHNLAKFQPRWAIELLQARLIDHVSALTLNEDGKVADLAIRDYSAAELVHQAAKAEPLAFVQTVVPYLRDVMCATALPPRDDALQCDEHFGFRFDLIEYGEQALDEALFSAATEALQTLTQTWPTEVRPILDSLASDQFYASQFLLYRALITGGATFADWAAELILEDDTRLDCGYVSDGDWVARELVRGSAPHLNNETHRQLEELFRDLRNPHEQGPSAGWRAFTFLSALDEARLSPVGVRRLGEYRRKFGLATPPQPRGMKAGAIGSPISSDAASRMTDEQWLAAMTKHATEHTNWDSFTGGARELSHVLKERVAGEPARFARLALRITADANPAYGDAVLMGFGDSTTDEVDPQSVFVAIRHIASFGHVDNDRWLGTALRRHYKDAPLDLVELVRDRALHSADPRDNSPVFVRNDDDSTRGKHLRTHGINTARGSLAEALGDLLVYDVDGRRTEAVRPYLQALASDPVLSVRSCVAHTIAASLRHARPDALGAFERLIDADDRLLASDVVRQLMIYVGNANPDVIDPVIQRMLNSTDDDVRTAGGALAALAALEWSRPELMPQALAADAHVRKGVAEVCAVRVNRTSNAELATSSLLHLTHDENDDVRQAVAQVAPHLRGQPLRPFAALLSALIESPSYEHARPQLLISLQYAPDKVDDLVLKAAQKFLEMHGAEATDIRTSAAGDVRYISELVIRGLAQSRNPNYRSDLLDIVDRLLELNVYGIGDAIAQSERI